MTEILRCFYIFFILKTNIYFTKLEINTVQGANQWMNAFLATVVSQITLSSVQLKCKF